jgi:NhaP-type Na+/H+ or K+/H+ antiporter
MRAAVAINLMGVIVVALMTAGALLVTGAITVKPVVKVVEVPKRAKERNLA